MGQGESLLRCGIHVDEARHDFGHFGHDPLGNGRELTVVAYRSAKEEPERSLVLGHETEVGPKPALHLLPPGSGPARLLADLLDEAQADVLQQLDVQGALVREVLVQDGLGDPGGLGHVVHRRGVEAGGGEHAAGDAEELAPAVVGAQTDAQGAIK